MNIHQDDPYQGLEGILGKWNYTYKYKINYRIWQRPLRTAILFDCIMNEGKFRREAGEAERIQMLSVLYIITSFHYSKYSLFLLIGSKLMLWPNLVLFFSYGILYPKSSISSKSVPIPLVSKRLLIFWKVNKTSASQSLSRKMAFISTIALCWYVTFLESHVAPR